VVQAEGERGSRPPPLHHSASPVRKFRDEAARLLLRLGYPSSVKIRRAESFFRGTFEEYSSANDQAIAPVFPERHLWDENKTSLHRGAGPRFSALGNQGYRNEFSGSIYRKWLQEGRRNRPWRPSWERTRRHRSGGSAPISCPMTTTFLEANPAGIAERDFPRIVLHPVPNPVLRRGRLSTCRPRNNRWNTDKNCTRQKPFHGRERPPFPRLFAGQIPSGASGVTPGHEALAQLARSVFCRVRGYNVGFKPSVRIASAADDLRGFYEHSRTRRCPHPAEQLECLAIRGRVRMALHQAHTTCNSSSVIDRVYDAVDGALYALQLPR
jgi:hypothetical protein